MKVFQVLFDFIHSMSAACLWVVMRNYCCTNRNCFLRIYGPKAAGVVSGAFYEAMKLNIKDGGLEDR